jgi:DNA-binding XRE family transcriptional regulator
MTATPKQELTAPPQTTEVTATVGEVTREVAAEVGEVAEVVEGVEGREGEGDGEVVEAAANKRGRRASGASRPKGGEQPNNVRKLRQAAMMSKAELARRAGVSPLTIDRVESGCPCRMDTKRKILEALGLSPSAREQVFGPDIDQG